jgi:hypothetical protein
MIARLSAIGYRLLVVLGLFLTGCTPAAPVPSGEPGPYGIGEPFLSAWHESGGETVGPPRSAPLWIDGFQVQLFHTLSITAVDGRRAVAEPLPAGWEAAFPADLLALPAAPDPALIELAPTTSAQAQPLAPLPIEVRIPGYSGPAELRLYAADLQPAGVVAFDLADGRGTAVVAPRGRLGPQWALALVGGAIAGARSDLFTLDAVTALHTGQPDLDGLYPRIRSFMERASVQYELNGRTVRGYRSPDNPLLWLRDHVYQGRGFRYFETDVTSALDAFREAQYPDGSLPDVLDYPELFSTAFRKEVEADVEFLYVLGVYEAWQFTGDDAWLRSHLEPMRAALNYATSDPLRWDAERGLVRRPYTIDTWDFAYGPTTISPDDGKPAPRHWITPDTVFGTFHGDNTGLAQAMRLMARIEGAVGEPERAVAWNARADEIMRRLNDLSWNGRFFTHVVFEDPTFAPAGVDPAEQLSLSNAYALNRGVLDERQGQAIVASYFERRDFERAFAEWYSIDPPFPSGSYGLAGRPGENPGEYVNGGIMPLVGGELARGAFRFGSEPYGFDILRRYAALTELTGASYLWYYPDGRPGISGPDTIGTDGWGSSAMLAALIEGAAGISDSATGYRNVTLSPRWAADPIFSDVHAVARYAAGDGYVAYRWQRTEAGITLSFTSTAESAYVRVLLPAEAPRDPEALKLTLNGAPAEFSIDFARESPYIAIGLAGGNAEIEVTWAE